MPFSKEGGNELNASILGKRDEMSDQALTSGEQSKLMHFPRVGILAFHCHILPHVEGADRMLGTTVVTE